MNDKIFPKLSRKSIAIIAISFLVVLLLLLVIKMQFNAKNEGINNFEECAKKYPILLTYPEQCMTSDGQIFTKE